MSEILISHEVPRSLLKESLNFNDYQFILPFYYKRCNIYKDFMNNYGGLKILDCGLFEGETYSIQDQIKMVNEINPTIYIVEDVWNDSSQTYKNAKYWKGLKNSGVIPPHITLMVVLQGKTFGDIEVLYHQCLDLGYTAFSFNHSSVAYKHELENEFPLRSEYSSIGRPKLIKRLLDKGVIKSNHYIHLLGATDINEFKIYNKSFPGVIDSLDTSGPILKALEGERYNDINCRKKPINKMEKYFNMDISPKMKEDILFNINFFKKITLPSRGA